MGGFGSKQSGTGLATSAFDPSMSGSERGKQVLSALLDSNKSYVAGDSAPQSELSPPSRRKHLADNGQAPDVAIIACADSRVAPEIVFGAGIGRVFVVRNAGNVAWGDSVVGSLEYAVAALNVPLVMVLGHSMCGAVGAAVGAVKGGAPGDGSPLGNHVKRIADVIAPCVGGQEELKDAVLKNVKDGVASLRKGSTAVGNAYQAGDISIVGGVYDLHTGEVMVIDQ